MGKNEVYSFRKHFLKKRCFRAWQVSVLGKVTTVSACNHYQKQLVKKCIVRWEEKHLFSRREWKLNIRAEYYYRFQTWQITFRTWTKFVLIKRKQKAGLSQANLFAQRLLLKQTFKAWKIFIKRKMFYNTQKSKADAKFRLILLWKYWHIWACCYEIKYKKKHKELIALHQWAENMLAKFFLCWKNAYAKHCCLMKKFQFFCLNRNIDLMVNSLKKWKKYSAVQVNKKRLTDYAQEIFAQNLMNTYLNHWKRAYQSLLNTKETELSIQLVSKNKIRRRYFCKLKSYVLLRKVKYKNLKSAHKQNEINAKVRTFIAFKKYAWMSKLKKDQKHHSIHFYSMKLKHSSLNKWISKFNQKDELKQYSLSKIADNYFRYRKLSLSMFHWICFYKYQTRKKKKLQLAEQHYDKTLMPKSFKCWFSFKNHCLTLKRMDLEALEFYRNLIFSKVFYTWLRDYKLHTHQDELYEVAVQFHHLQAKSYYFKIWKRKANIRILSFMLKKLADDHYKLKIKRFCFQQWKYRERNLNKASLHFKNSIKKKIWQSLKKKHLYCKQKVAKENHAVSYYNKKIKNEVLKRWKVYTLYEVLINQISNERYMKKLTILCSWVMFCWKKFHRISKHNKIQFDLAKRHYENQLANKVFCSLRFFSSKCIQQRFYEEESLIRAQITLEKGILRHAFQKWERLMIDFKFPSGRNYLSKNHYRRTFQRKVLIKWKSFQQFSHKTKLMKQVSSRFLTLCVWRRFYNVWLKKHLSHLLNERKNHMVLWWWSIRLQKKVFTSWKMFVLLVQEKKTKYKDALKCNEALFDKALINQMRFAINKDMRRELVNQDTRRELANQDFIEKSIDLRDRVHKYAFHWLLKTKSSHNKKADYVRHNKERTAELGSPTIVFVSPEKERPLILSCNHTRPKPRIPDYLRESFDVNVFDSSNSKSELQTVAL